MGDDQGSEWRGCFSNGIDHPKRRIGVRKTLSNVAAIMRASLHLLARELVGTGDMPAIVAAYDPLLIFPM